MKNIVFLIYSCLVLAGGRVLADDCETYYDSVFTKNVASIETEKMCAERKASAIVASMKQDGQASADQQDQKKALANLAVKEFKETVDLLSRASKGEDVAVELCQHLAKKQRVQDAKFQLINKSSTTLDMFLENKLEEIISMHRLTNHNSRPISCASVDNAESFAFTTGGKSLAYKGPSAVLLNARNVSVRWMSIIEGLKEMGALEKGFIDVQELNATYKELERALAQAKQKGLLNPADTTNL